MKHTAIDIDIRGSEYRDAATASSRWLRAVLRWWPVLGGLALGVAGLFDIQPWTPSDRTTWILPVFALAYLIFGAARGQLRRPGVLRLQTAGLLGFGHANKVVPRWYVESCFVIDLLGGAALIVAPTL